MPRKQNLVLVTDLDERGLFKAHVEDTSGKEVFSFSNEDEDTGWPDEDGLWLVNDGHMRHGRDVCGLLDYMQTCGIAGQNASLRLGS
ncbi:MAG: hypothetical protein KJ558_10140 [Gammaproteobacteria bacterium]|nr:hypothetical protein [Gammaproteobacteria bacterium]MBU1655166.1 hypothetical protein [Gammaproteobacteria bacterium]MBU1959977.1 hypothetical protein [Gammaproteobacteria bacterium]